MGGIGKSVLASALAHRPEVRRAFPDGIFWITLGQKPQLAELQRWLARELGDEALFPDERSGKECLRALLVGRKALLVLDDVWQREDAEAFNVIGAMGRILLTTRDAGLVTALASNETHYRVELPTEVEAETIFASAAQSKTDAPAMAISLAEVREIVAQCGRLPLALALCGGMVQKGVAPEAVLEALRRHALRGISTRHPEAEQHRNLWVAMEASLEVLPPEEQKRFIELAVFPLDRGAPQAAVDTLWQHTGGLEPYESQILLAELAERSLVQKCPATEGDEDMSARMTLHDLLHNFATGMAEKLLGSSAALHQTLLDAYQKKCPAGWSSGPDDGYFFQNLCEHLLAAGKLDDAVGLLTGLPWIEAKCKARLVFSLQDDYRNTIAAMPEAQEGLRQGRERQARMARWTEEITAYSRQWSERRDRLARGAAESEPEPQLPEPPAAGRMWTEEEIETEGQRMIEAPTRLDRIRAFSGFVEQEFHQLTEFGTRMGFVVQHAFNNGPRGSVHGAAIRGLSAVDMPLLTRHWFDQDPYNPKPALLRTLEGHTHHVKSVSVTPDGLRAVSASLDRTLRVWDLETGRCLRTLEGHTHYVDCVSVTPDGLRAVSASWDRTLRVWDLKTGRCLRTLEGHTHYVVCVSVTPDGLRAVSAGLDETLRVWDLETGRCLRVLEGHTEEWATSVTPDALRSVSVGADIAGVDKTIRGLDLETGQCLRVWDLETGQCLRVLEGHTRRVTSVSVTPNGLRAVSASADKTLRVWELETGQCLRVLEGHTDRVLDVSVTPDGLYAVSASADKTLRVWELETGRCLRVLDGYTAGADWSVSVAPDGQRAVSAGSDETLRLWDLETGRWLRVLEGHSEPVTSVSVTADGLRAVSASADKTLRGWDLETGQCLRVLEGHTDWVSGVSVTPDGLCAVSASRDETLRVWDLEKGLCVLVLKGHWEPVSDVGVISDGRFAVTASERILRVWNLETGQDLRVLAGHTDLVTRLSVTVDGLRAVSASADKTLRVWDLETGLWLGVLEGHAGSVNSVSVTADGLHAISTSGDGTLRVWEAETGRCLALACLPAPASSIALSSKLDQVVAGISTGQVLQFDLRGLSLTVASQAS
jgi:WD40 repeat protein